MFDLTNNFFFSRGLNYIETYVDVIAIRIFSISVGFDIDFFFLRLFNFFCEVLVACNAVTESVGDVLS